MRNLPRAFSEEERSYIIKRLKEEAVNCLTQYGVRKTSVDELVKRVKIPKGTFYLFYPSKELLFIEVFQDLHDEIQSEFMQSLMVSNGVLDENQFCDILFQQMKKVDHSFMLNLMTNGDLELIMRKLPQEVVQKHLEHDDFSFENITALFPNAKQVNGEAFSGAFRAIFLSMLHKREIGEEVFDEALILLIRGLVKQLF